MLPQEALQSVSDGLLFFLDEVCFCLWMNYSPFLAFGGTVLACGFVP